MKRALITGGSGDIGSAICLRLASAGHHVVVHANRNPDRAETLVEEIRSLGGSAETCCFDVRETESAAQAIEKLLTDGPIQILIHNAGIHDDAPLAGMQPNQWQRVIDVSLNGFYNVTQPLLLPMMATRWGRIISISSIAGIMGNRGQANYAAAKAGLHGACKSLAIEVASRGLTVNTIAPGIISGHLTDQVFDDQAIKQIVPMKRAGKPEEVASLVNYLASQEAGYISGQILSINGAMA
ncbi:MAG: 3-oxoacyl-ACP reductase FabG [Candidatus Thiodiazotropha sp. (ex Monitilora ramsayi)]|nr:3-oxoacyl-ACP reductase FabG [Candidatus Thiodiazotropha sp. (ex Monitilora ramsayi)]